jgi:L-rhamnose mutarotase
MLQALSRVGWHNYSLYLRDDGLLVGYLETPNFQQALLQMEQADVNERWQRDMQPFFIGLAGRPDQGMMRLQEISI